MADLLFPFFLLIFMLINIFLRKIFPFITKTELLIFFFWVPAFFLLILIAYEKSGIKLEFIKNEAAELIRSLLSASIGASILTLFMK